MSNIVSMPPIPNPTWCYSCCLSQICNSTAICGSPGQKQNIIPNPTWCYSCCLSQMCNSTAICGSPGQNQNIIHCIFESIATFEALQCGTFVKGGAHTCCVNVVSIDEFTQHVCLNGSSTLERFKRSNVSEICNGIMFNFYPGLPHRLLQQHIQPKVYSL